MIIANPITSEQNNALKAFMKALGIEFSENLSKKNNPIKELRGKVKISKDEYTKFESYLNQTRKEWK